MQYRSKPNFDLVSSGSFRDKYPAGKLNLNIDIADLEIEFACRSYENKATVDADIQSADLDYLNGIFKQLT
jgi:hypothetical protein